MAAGKVDSDINDRKTTTENKSKKIISGEGQQLSGHNIPRLSTIEIVEHFANFPKINQCIAEIGIHKKLISKTWNSSYTLTLGIGILAFLLGVFTFDNELWGGGDSKLAGLNIIDSQSGINAISGVTFFQILSSFGLWLLFISRLWKHYPLMKGHSSSLIIAWLAGFLAYLGLHAPSPTFPFTIDSSGFMFGGAGFAIMAFFTYIFYKAVVETRDIHVEEKHHDTDARKMSDSLVDHSLYLWSVSLVAWLILTNLSAWSGVHYIAIRPHGSIFWLLIHITSGMWVIFGIMHLLWFPQYMLGSDQEMKIESKRSREIAKSSKTVNAIVDKESSTSGVCPECNSSVGIKRNAEGTIEIECESEICNGFGSANSKCSLCKKIISARYTCKKCGLNASVLEYLPDTEVW